MAAKVAVVPELVKLIIGNFVETGPEQFSKFGLFQDLPDSSTFDNVWDVFKELDNTSCFAGAVIQGVCLSSLLDCRLVCRTWNVFAMELFFGSQDVCLSIDPLDDRLSWRESDLDTADKERECLLRLQEARDLCEATGPKNVWGRSIRRLNIDLSNLPCFTRVYQDTADGTADMSKWVDSRPSFHLRGCFEEHRRRAMTNRDGLVRTVAELLEAILETLKCTNRLTIRFPSFTALWERGEAHAATCINEAQLEQIFKVIESGLGNPAIATNLTDLTLGFPTTWHVVQAFKALHQGDSESLSRLRHVRIVMMDDSGVSGNREYLNHDLEEGRNDDGLWEEPGPMGVGHPPSNLQLAYPNRAHQDAMWEWLGKCGNLEALAVHATHQLDLSRFVEKLDAAPGKPLRHLKVLHLSRVYVTFLALTRLLIPSQIRRLSLNDLIMRDHCSSNKDTEEPDTWADVFRYLRRYCHLMDLVKVRDLRYWSTHPLFKRQHMGDGDNRFVWSKDYHADRRPYEFLLKRIGRRRVGGGYTGGGEAREYERWIVLRGDKRDAVDPDTDEEFDEGDE